MPKKKQATSDAVEGAEKKKVEKVQSLRGMKDMLPREQLYWRWIIEHAMQVAEEYGFERIDVPVLEPTNLFIRAVGKATDIVEKEMFSFVDQGGGKVSLRPEFTASLVRAYVEHGMAHQPQPIQWYTIGPLFRHERPQAGRLRQHYQFDCEVIGSPHPVIDAQLMIMGHQFFSRFGISVRLHVNSIGCATCRPPYMQALVQYYKGHKKALCEHCVRRLQKNPLRLLDCKEERCQPVKAQAPQSVDWLCDGCKDHFFRTLEYVDELNLPYHLDAYLVRGLDYYTRTVFEFQTSLDDALPGIALGGGGRYDDLVQIFSGQEVPGAGFGIGIERLIYVLRNRDITPPARASYDIFVAQIGEAGRRRALGIFETLRKNGFRVIAAFAKDTLRAQLEIAHRSGVQYTVIIGQKEVMEGTALLREMEGGAQEIVNADRLSEVLEKRITRMKTMTAQKESMSHVAFPPSITGEHDTASSEIDDTKGGDHG